MCFRRFFVVLAATILSMPAETDSQVQRCTKEYLSIKENDLPSVTIFKPNESDIEGIQRIYECVFGERSLPFRGTRVIAANGESFGEVSGILVDDDSVPAFLMVSYGGFLGMGESTAALPVAALLLSNEDHIATTIDADAVKKYGQYDLEIAAARGSFTVVTDSIRIEYLVGWLGSFFSGYLPASRIVLSFISDPPGADVILGDEVLGITVFRGMARRSELSAISLVLSGYQPCAFVDGTLRESDVTGQAMFICTLVPNE